jgi:molybdenum cofactor cytidylyltransferase
MNILRALRIDPHVSQYVAFVGAGGKTTALFQLARELADGRAAIPSAVIVTATTHLGAWQISAADQHLIPKDLRDPDAIPDHGIILVTDEFENDRTKPISQNILNWLREKSQNENLSLLIEADGARQKPLKAPAAHEPPIPDFVDVVVVVAGLSALGKPLDDRHVHRAEIFSQISGLKINEIVTPESITRVLTHPQGGLKSIPTHARRIALLNQADTSETQSIGGVMARKLLDHFDAVSVGSLQQKKLQTMERCAGIILAAGESKRFGVSKQLLDWKGKPFVRHIAETALRAGLDPVIVVTGFDSAQVESALIGLPVNIVHNANYQQGQSASIKKGIEALPANVGSALFLLADQPQIPVEVIRALVESHTREMQAILAPLVLEDRRANPVLFDRVTFADLLKLEGDVGGRGIFDKHRVEYLPWHDELLLFDVDRPEDYERLKNL